MKPDKRLDVKLALTITDQGKPYSSSLVTWDEALSDPSTRPEAE